MRSSWTIELDNTSKPTHEPFSLIIGGTGASGKTTMCQRLSQRYNLVYISAFKLIQDEILRNSEFSEKIKRCYDSGVFVPDDVIAKVVEQRLEAVDCERNGIMVTPMGANDRLGYGGISSK